MISTRLHLATAALVFLLAGCGRGTHVGVSAALGGPPVCPYGYYEVAPFNCAPDGYYGPEWFDGGVFVGAGPWFHGREGFYGHVDHRLDFRHGYRGGFPARGEAPAQRRAEFHGNAMHDPRGHEHR